MGKTTTWMVNMKKLVGQGELGGLMVRLMMALQDFAQANHAMQAWKTEQSLKPKSRKVGAARYFLRMQISHIFEAFEIVQNEIEKLKAAIEACDPQTKKSYQTVIEFIKSDDYTQGALYVTRPHRRGAARARSLWPARAPMELNASGMAARTDAAGEPILLWTRTARSGTSSRSGAALEQARKRGGEGGVYALQAAIIACHAQAEKAEATDWPRIAALYAHLAAVAPSSIVELNRAVAVGMPKARNRG